MVLRSRCWLPALGCWVTDALLPIYRAAHADSISYAVRWQKLPTPSQRRVARTEIPLSRIASYRDLEAWQSAMELLLVIYDIASRLPHVERFERASQMRRAAVSVPSNVAEGQAHGPSARYLHHVRIAPGSLAELDTHLEAILRLGYLTNETLAPAFELLHRSGRLLHGLERSLRLRQAAGWCLAFAGFVYVGAAFLLS